ncbi:MAG: sigma 54-interacting transcriptional regulator, partial [Candidatus Methylomirabilis sp.]|nr:sigma 54-interacting transcriptional regulator [Deltaproteobacteria bacterium]
REVEVDVRIVATTKTSLHEAAAKGRFRDDLLYRLCGLEIHVPPLRERGDDVILIAHEMLARGARVDGAVGKVLAPETADALRRYRWPGNVRELRRALESAAILCRGEEIRPEHLPDFVRAAGDAAGGGGLFDLHLERRERIEFNDAVHAFEQALVAWALRRAGGQQTLAADLLGLPRTTLQSKLNHKNGS